MICREPILIVDFPKEFDLIDHNILLKEPSSFIDPVLVNWIKAFLSDRRQAVRIGNFLSDWKFLKVGIAAGDKTWCYPVYGND